MYKFSDDRLACNTDGCCDNGAESRLNAPNAFSAMPFFASSNDNLVRGNECRFFFPSTPAHGHPSNFLYSALETRRVAAVSTSESSIERARSGGCMDLIRRGGILPCWLSSA